MVLCVVSAHIRDQTFAWNLCACSSSTVNCFNIVFWRQKYQVNSIVGGLASD